MKAMLLEHLGVVAAGTMPLRATELSEPRLAAGELLVRVHVCGVCHTELDEIEGRTPPASLPMILGHQAVGSVVAVADDVKQFALGDRVGIAWIFSACGQCEYCDSGRENLCPSFRATGRDRPGGYAEFMTVPAGFAYLLPSTLSDLQVAPLLCAGAIGYRSLSLTNLVDGQPIGLTGFGASAHLVLKMICQRYPHSEVFVFARSENERRFALELGATWAGDTGERAPSALAAIIDTTPAWTPIVAALRNLAPGGRLVINAIRKEDTDKSALSGLDYPSQLWLEKEIKTVANVTRRDVTEMLALAAEWKLHAQVETYSLHDANRALIDLKTKPVRGAKVLVIKD